MFNFAARNFSQAVTIILPAPPPLFIILSFKQTSACICPLLLCQRSPIINSSFIYISEDTRRVETQSEAQRISWDRLYGGAGTVASYNSITWVTYWIKWFKCGSWCSRCSIDVPFEMHYGRSLQFKFRAVENNINEASSVFTTNLGFSCDFWKVSKGHCRWRM